MSTKVADFLNEVMRRRKRLPSQLARDIGVSHATVIRWMNGYSPPSSKSCQALADYSGEPLLKVLAAAGHIRQIPQAEPDSWPEFGEYARRKYPNVLSKDVVAVVEGLIERNRGGKV